MLTLRENTAVLIFPAIVCLGVACERRAGSATPAARAWAGTCRARA